MHRAEFVGGEASDGEFTFGIQNHEEDTFNSPITGGKSHVGETIFFSVDIETSIVGVEFSVTGM